MSSRFWLFLIIISLQYVSCPVSVFLQFFPQRKLAAKYYLMYLTIQDPLVGRCFILLIVSIEKKPTRAGGVREPEGAALDTRQGRCQVLNFFP
jgi:hypothetical protein